MTGTTIRVPVDGGQMSAYCVRPSGGAGPGIILLHEIFGVNEAMRTAADDLASEGFVVVVPDLFWRIKPGIELGYSDEERRQAIAYWGAFDVAAGTADARDCVAAVRTLPGVSRGVGLLGFCLGGKLAVLASTTTGVKAAVAFYPVRLNEDLAAITDIRSELLLHFGDADTHVPPEMRHAIARVTDGMENVRTVVHEGAGHGFYNSRRPDVFDASSASAARALTLAHFRAAMGRDSG